MHKWLIMTGVNADEPAHGCIEALVRSGLNQDASVCHGQAKPVFEIRCALAPDRVMPGRATTWPRTTRRCPTRPSQGPRPR